MAYFFLFYFRIILSGRISLRRKTPSSKGDAKPLSFVTEGCLLCMSVRGLFPHSSKTNRDIFKISTAYDQA